MNNTYWQKQGSEPLFPELEWNKPERRDQAGQLLIVGGNMHGLNAPAKAYETARRTGIGEAHVALPHKTKRLVAHALPEAIFLPSTISGEFAQDANAELLEYAQVADTVLLPGDSGRNSQTAILFETLLKSYNFQIVLTRDAVDILQNYPSALLERPRTIIVVSFAQLQKLLQNYQYSTPLSFTMDLVKLIELVQNLTQSLPISLLTLHQNQLIAASGGKVSTTKFPDTPTKPWRLNAAAIAACYATWNNSKIFESLTQTAYLITQDRTK